MNGNIELRQEIVRRLALCPNEMYALLQGRIPLWFAELELLLALKLTGLSKEELLEAVFACWAEAAVENQAGGGINPAAGLASELARLERKGPAISSGEWLAEAAAEGSLHQPGTLFHEVGDRPFPDDPVVAVAAEDWQALLPQTPKVQEGLALVMRRVAETAARRAREHHKS
ncbi:hypothetical protein PaeBR_02200 [Paenibacillus sp. BR2-3]|uniref:hypothetical protein n=1 Tax=Paenibacillus sp. BR2-3 TaxID=3048494 RepID=UPI003977D5C2